MTTKAKTGKSGQRYSQRYKTESLALAERAEELAIVKKTAAYFAESLKRSTSLVADSTAFVSAENSQQDGSKSACFFDLRNQDHEYSRKTVAASMQSGKIYTPGRQGNMW